MLAVTVTVLTPLFHVALSPLEWDVPFTRIVADAPLAASADTASYSFVVSAA